MTDIQQEARPKAVTPVMPWPGIFIGKHCCAAKRADLMTLPCCNRIIAFAKATGYNTDTNNRKDGSIHGNDHQYKQYFS